MSKQDAGQEEVELWTTEDVVNLVATDPAAAAELLARAPQDELEALMDHLMNHPADSVRTGEDG